MLCATIASRSDGLIAQTIRERAPELFDAEPPVVVVKRCSEARGTQMQLQLQIGIDDDAERHDGRRSRQAQRGQASESDVDGIDPQHIVRIGRGAVEAELRAHDPGDDDDPE